MSTPSFIQPTRDSLITKIRTLQSAVEDLLPKGISTVVAGGAVRDCVARREFRDLDLFILGVPPGSNRAARILEEVASSAIADYWTAPSEESSAVHADCLVGSYEIRGYKVELIIRDERSLLELIDNFDLNICQYGLKDDNTILTPEGKSVGLPAEIRVNPRRVYHGALDNEPLRLLNRMMRFSKRYTIPVNREDLEMVCKLMVDVTQQAF